MRLRAIWSHSLEACHWRLQMRRSCRARTMNRRLAICAAQHIQPRHGRRSFLSNAVEELGLEWSLPEEPSHSRLDEWFLPERRQAPRQRASSFFPEVHDKITKSWRATYSSTYSPTCLFFLRPHFGRQRGWKRIWQPASPGWVSGHASLPTHGHWLEGKSRPQQIHGQLSGARAPSVVEPDGDEGCR